MRPYRVDDSLPSPVVGASAREAAERALALCGDGAADGPQAFINVDLNQALDPLRLHPAVGVRCGRCDFGIAYLALTTQGATVVSGNVRRPPKQRGGGIYDLGDLTQSSTAGRGTIGWQADADAARGSVTPTGEREGSRIGLAQRRTHTCKECSANYTHNNTTLLRKYLGAIASGDNKLRL